MPANSNQGFSSVACVLLLQLHQRSNIDLYAHLASNGHTAQPLHAILESVLIDVTVAVRLRGFLSLLSSIFFPSLTREAAV